MSNQTAVNETLIREVVEQVLGRLSQAKAAPASCSSAASPARSEAPRPASASRHFGVFQDAREACEAAADAFAQLAQKGMAGRRKVIELVKEISFANCGVWGKLELDETHIGRLDHKIEKLTGLRGLPGVEFLQPYALSGDHGIMLEEYAPFGVIGAVTPSTHSIPTMAANIISMAAAGNSVVFNPHPGAVKCAVVAARVFNEAIFGELGIENLACVIEQPTLETFQAIAKNEHVKLLCVTGGPGVVKAAMSTGKRAICAGPGNPPVLVDETAEIERAARAVILGGAYDNNLLCIGEKEVFVLDGVADAFMSALEKNGAARINAQQLERLTKEAFIFPEGQGGGCSHAAVSRQLIGRDASVLARIAGARVAEGTQLLFAETDANHLFVEEEQMMPFVPIVRVSSVEEGIAAAKKAEHGYKHSAIIHSHNVSNMTAMGKALDTTLFIKNGACVAGLGSGGEGYSNFSIATTTGEGICTPRTFTRTRRCVLVDNLRIV